MTTIPTNPAAGSAPVQVFLPQVGWGELASNPAAAAQFGSHFVRPDIGVNGFARVFSIPFLEFRTRGGEFDAERFSSIYPVPPDGRTSPTFVRERSELRMSDIPQMAAEFARTKRDDLAMLHFLDELAKCYEGKEDLGNYEELSLAEKRHLAEEITRVGLDITNLDSIRFTMSRAIRQFGHRYPKLAKPNQIIYPLLIVMGAGMIDCNFTTDVCGYIARISDDADDEQLAECVEELSERYDFTCDVAELKRLVASLNRIHEIYQERPSFVRKGTNFPPLCILKSGSGVELTPEFVQGPSKFMEAQQDVHSGPLTSGGRRYRSLTQYCLDVGRIKRFKLNGVSIISKRIEPLRVKSIEGEILQAEEFARVLREEGLDDCKIVDYVGLVYDSGNFYILMREEKGPNLFSLVSGIDTSLPLPAAAGRFSEVKAAVSHLDLEDFEPRNAIVMGDGGLAFFDFEMHTDVAGTKRTPPRSEAIAYALASKAKTRVELQPVTAKGSGFDVPGPVRRYDGALLLHSKAKRRGSSLPTVAAVGDVHSNATRLGQLLEHPDIAGASRRVFLGDYFDREGDPMGVFRLLKANADAHRDDVHLMGNHELFFMLAMAGSEQVFYRWISNGGLEFISSVMDMHEFEEAFRRIMDSSDKMGVYDVMERMNAEHPDIVNRLHAAVRENAELLEIYDWLVDNAHLSYVDEYSQLYIHAGLLAAGALDMGLFGRLDEEEYALMGLFRMLRGNGDPARARDVEAQAGRISGHLEVRPTDWQKDFLNSGGFPVLMEVLTDLGIRGIIYGHTPVGDVKPHTARVWNLDLGMGAHYGGRGGAVVFGPTGVHSYIFRDFSSPEITKEEVVKGEEFMFDLEDDSALIARAFREYFMHAAAAVTPAAAVASDEEEE